MFSRKKETPIPEQVWKKTSYSLEKFYCFKSFTFLKVDATRTFEMLQTFAYGSALTVRGHHLPVPFCITLNENDAEGSHL